ncbi:MAG: hypothetical protein WC563_16275 [Brevundimonas sp.]
MTKPKKPKIGRPAGAKRAGTTAPRVTVQLRVAEREAEAYVMRAKALDLSVSEWLRMLARRDCGLFPHDATESAQTA